MLTGPMLTGPMLTERMLAEQSFQALVWAGFLTAFLLHASVSSSLFGLSSTSPLDMLTLT